MPPRFTSSRRGPGRFLHSAARRIVQRFPDHALELAYLVLAAASIAYYVAVFAGQGIPPERLGYPIINYLSLLALLIYVIWGLSGRRRGAAGGARAGRRPVPLSPATPRAAQEPGGKVRP